MRVRQTHRRPSGARPRGQEVQPNRRRRASPCRTRRATRRARDRRAGRRRRLVHGRRLAQQRRHRAGRPPVLVETPLNDARTQAVIDRVKQLAPGKPIRSRQQPPALRPCRRRARGGRRRRHDRHPGATTCPTSSASWRSRTASAPTRMAQSRQDAGLPGRAANGSTSAMPAGRSRCTASPAARTRGFLMVYLPREKLLIEADAYTPGAAEHAAAGGGQREQPQPDRQHRAPEARGRPHRAAARPGRAAGRALHGDAADAGAALTHRRELGAFGKSADRGVRVIG